MDSNRKIGVVVGFAFFLVIAASMLTDFSAFNPEIQVSEDNILVSSRPILGNPVEIIVAFVVLSIPVFLFRFFKKNKVCLAVGLVGAPLAVRFWGVGFFAPLVFSLGSLFFYYILYSYRLVPRWLSVWGILGALLFLLSVFSPFFGYGPSSTIFLILHTPGGLNQMALGAWLIFKGFNSNPNFI